MSFACNLHLPSNSIVQSHLLYEALEPTRTFIIQSKMQTHFAWASLLSLVFAAIQADQGFAKMYSRMKNFRSASGVLNSRNINTAFASSSYPSTKFGPSATRQIQSSRCLYYLNSYHGRFHTLATAPSSTIYGQQPNGSSHQLQASLVSTTIDDVDVLQDEGQSIPSFATELNPSQIEATLRPRYSITRVIAGPGAGKTKVLTTRIAHLLLDTSHESESHSSDNQWNNNREGILAVTFTKKASMEMERRLTDLLSSATTQPESQLDDTATGIPSEEEGLEEGEYVQYGNADPSDSADDVNDISRQLMKRTTVGTFHSVCSKILRKFGRELGDLPSVRNCIGVPNSAGATIAQQGIQTDDGSSEEEDGQQSSNQMLMQTLDGSFNILDQSDQLRLLKEVLEKHNIQLKSASGSSGGGNNDIRPITVLNAISLFNTYEATKLTSPGGNKKEEEELASKMSKKVARIAAEIRVSFQKAKYKQNSVDFDDLILLARELLLRHPEVREVLHRRWRHLLVDEFQDTSGIQLDLVRLLTTNSLFVVGDGDQSIYSWRGASPESMSDFEVAFHDRSHAWEDLLHGHNEPLSEYLERISGIYSQEALLKVKSVYLMENYRSTTNIVKAAQRIISTSDKLDDSATAQDNIRRDMKPMRGTGPSPRVLACKDGRKEARFVVTTINSMIDDCDLTPTSTVALIYRTNAQSRLLEEACVEHNLRYVVRGSSGTFYKRAEIQDCMSFLKVMYNDRDRSAWARAVKAPSRGIGLASINEFFRYCDAVTDKYLETADNRGAMPTPMDVLTSLAPTDNQGGNAGMQLVPPKDHMSTRSINRFIPFASSMGSLRRKAETQAVPDFLLSMIEDLGLKSHFDSISKTRDEYEDRLSNVMELVRAAERYKEDGPCIGQSVGEEESMETPLGNFLDDVALIADISPDDEAESEGGGRVVANLMTIHASKGMEFDAVFLVGNEEGTFPSQRSIAEGEGSIELSEEKRLCYVAMTRAKTHLVLTWRREVAYFAGASFKTKDADRSRFLDILVSKKAGDSKTKKVQKTKTKPSLQSRSYSTSATKTSARDGRGMVAMTKRQLSSEADRLLTSRGNSREARNGHVENGRGVRSVTTKAQPYRVDRPQAPKGSSWDNWEPSSGKKPIGEVPSIQPNGLGQGQTTAQTRGGPPQPTHSRPRTIIGSSRGQMASPRRLEPSMTQTQAQRQQLDQRNAQRQPLDSRQAQRQALDRRQVQPSTRAAQKSGMKGEAPPELDSTMFYPVGSAVKHKLHGQGVVKAPPDGDSDFADKMLVRVKFVEDNSPWDLPMDGLVHIYD